MATSWPLFKEPPERLGSSPAAASSEDSSIMFRLYGHSLCQNGHLQPCAWPHGCEAGARKRLATSGRLVVLAIRIDCDEQIQL